MAKPAEKVFWFQGSAWEPNIRAAAFLKFIILQVEPEIRRSQVEPGNET